MPKQKTEELGFFSKSEKVRLNGLYSMGEAAYGSIQNLSKASGLSNQGIVNKLWSTNLTFPKTSSFF